jgi:hypothetical protein
MLAFEFAFAPELVFSVLVQPANAKLSNTIDDHKQAFFLISKPPSKMPEARASAIARSNDQAIARDDRASDL